MRLRFARGPFLTLVPEWRNWQTRCVQVAVIARSWRFESSLGHQFLKNQQPCSCKWKFPLALLQEKRYFPVEAAGEQMADRRIDLPQGTLDLLILRTLALETQHGWAISERIHQVSSKTLFVQQGSLYPALHRLERKGWIKARWGASENNRRAKFYELTASGRKQLELEESTWRKLAAAVAQILETT